MNIFVAVVVGVVVIFGRMELIFVVAAVFLQLWRSFIVSPFGGLLISNRLSSCFSGIDCLLASGCVAVVFFLAIIVCSVLNTLEMIGDKQRT